MSTFTWTNTSGGDWAVPSDWNTGTVPSSDTAVAVIPGANSSYTVTLGSGDNEIINALTLGDFSHAAGPTLSIGGTLTFAGSSPSLTFESGALQIASGGVLDGQGVLGTGPQGFGVSIVNNGAFLANAGSSTALAVVVAFTNNGTVLADNGTAEIEGSTLTNLSGTTLTGGSWIAQGPTAGTFNEILLGFNYTAVIGTDDANIVLDGVATDIDGYNGGFQPIEQQLQTIGSTGTLQLLDDRGYTTANTLSDAGSLILQGGSLSTGGLTLIGAGSLDGFGVVDGSVANQGAVIANGGALDIADAISGSGNFTVAAGASLILNGATAATLVNNGVAYDASGLLDIAGPLSGSGTLVVQDGATIEISGASAQTVDFSGTNATLLLDDYIGYSGTLSGFAQGDSLELAGTSATSAFLSGSTLVVLDNSTTVDTVQLAGSFAAGASFAVSNVGTDAVITNLSGAPPRDDFAFTITLNDSDGLTTAQENQIVNDLSAAALDWAQYVTGHAPLRIQLNITSGASGSELANGGFATSVASGEVINGRTVIIPSSIYALTTGNYIAGSTADVVVNLPLGTNELDSSGGLYVNPSPFSGGGSVPSNEFDLVTVFRHELAHGLGFGGLTTQSGSLGSDETLYDSYIQDTVSNGTITAANFVGPDAEAAYGVYLGTDTPTPVPLTLLNNGENFAHFANSSSDPLGKDLMSGVGLTPGTQRDISSVDLAVLEDVGLPVTALCFVAGTRIATPGGEVPVERIAAGDRVLTASGVTRPVEWIGTGKVLVTPGHRSAATPVIVRKGALADNVPNRDLHITKGHSLFLDGALIPVEFLVNHRSILWDDRAREVTIHHVELESHDVLLANGAPAESYRDDGNRWLFHNANTRWGAEPQTPCAPLLTGGEHVDRIWRRLLDRAGPRPGLPMTDDADVHLLVDGMRVDAIERSAVRYVFRVPARPRGVRLCSRAGVPQELGLGRDARSLGVAVHRIVLLQSTGQRVTEADDARLMDGFHRYEADHRIRWTDGDAAIPAGLFAGVEGAAMLIVHLNGEMQYVDDGRMRQVA